MREVQIHDQSGTFTDPTTVDLHDGGGPILPRGCTDKLCALVDVTGAGASTWTFTLNWVSPSGAVYEIASVAGVNSAAVAKLLFNATNFPDTINGYESAIPMPNQLIIDRTAGSGNLTAKFFLFY